MFLDRFVNVFSVIDNKTRLLQESGKNPLSHNISKEKEIRKLYESNSLSRKHSKSLVKRLVSNITLTCAFKPTKIHSIKMNQVCFTDIDGEKVLQIFERISGSNDELKDWQKGFHNGGRKPKDVIV